MFLRLLITPLGLTTFLQSAVAAVPAGPISLRGSIAAHDPSTMIQCKDRYYIFSTGQGILSKSSADQVYWVSGPPVFTAPPAWTTAAVPGFSGIFWAPDILFFNNKYYLYYAVSTFGSQISAIGLVTNPTLDPTDPSYQWSDQGMVIQSTNGSPYNTIDPSFTWDSLGNLWMAFGSYWNGIYDVQLNPVTGLRISPISPTYRLADNSSIEASAIYRRGGYYYLFVNWGSCCSGVHSTYNVRVGRSTNVTGPFLDRNGVDMVNGGGTLFLQGSGKYVGPGHVGIISDGTNEWFTYHYYDANAWAPQYNAYGNADFDFAPLSWTGDGWPAFTNDWSAVYRFQADATDDRGQYFGLLQNGATIQNDPIHGHVLNLNGTNQYVWLPPGVAYAKTFAAVVKWRGGGQWQRIFDFGVDTSATVMLTPASGDNVLRCDINPGGNLQILQWNQPLPANVWTHVAVVLDGSRGVLYVNGSPVVTNSAMTFLPVNVAPQTNHLGRSKFTADPYFNGQFASFRAYGRALSAAEIAAPLPNITQPSSGTTWAPGQTLLFSGDATDFMDVPLSASNLTWRIQYAQDGVTNLVFGPVSNTTDGSYTIPSTANSNGIYMVTLTATDSAARSASATVTLSAGNTSLAWSSFYPFTSGAQDSSNHYDGVMLGGASIQSDPAQGSVLNLSGANQYLSLPAGAANAQTVEAWVKWRGGNAWQRIFDFGRDTQHYFFLTPKDASGLIQCAITPDAATYNQVIQSKIPFPTNQWCHVAVTMDGRQGVLYLNGTAIAVNNSVNLFPSDLLPSKALIGRSEFSADPYLNAQLDSLALNSRALSSLNVLQDFLQPRLQISTSGAQTILSWPSWAAMMQLYSTTNLSSPWRVITNPPSLSGGNLTLSLPLSGTNAFYRLQWP